jgi:hypothetical protein
MKPFLSLAFLVICTNALADAPPYCVIMGDQNLCMYSDHAICKEAAADAKGKCIDNPAAKGPYKGKSPWCVASSTGTLCSYDDKTTCRDAARSVNGALCVQNQER